MDEAREGTVLFLMNYLPGASKLRPLHYERPESHTGVWLLPSPDEAITFLVFLCPGQTPGPVASNCLGLMPPQLYAEAVSWRPRANLPGAARVS